MTPKDEAWDKAVQISGSSQIELIYDPDCSNVERARERLRQAVAERDQGDGTLDPSPPVTVILTALREQSACA